MVQPRYTFRLIRFVTRRQLLLCGQRGGQLRVLVLLFQHALAWSSRRAVGREDVLW